MINSVVLVGRLTRDPELRRTNNGTAVTTFTLAVDNAIKNANGERTASFIPCNVWSTSAENVAKYARKGSLVGVSGRLQQRSYDSKDGRKVSIIEVVCQSVQFLEPKGNNASRNDEPIFEDITVDDADSNNNLSSIGGADDDLPF